MKSQAMITLIFTGMLILSTSNILADTFRMKSGEDIHAYVVKEKDNYFKASFSEYLTPPFIFISKDEISQRIPEGQETFDPEPKEDALVPIIPQRNVGPSELTIGKALLEIVDIDQELDLFLEQFIVLLEEAQKTRDHEKTLTLLLEVMHYIEEAKNKVAGIKPIALTEDLVATMLGYYEHLLAYHSILMKRILADDPEIYDEELNKAHITLQLWDETFDQQLTDLIAQHDLIPESDYVSSPQEPAGQENFSNREMREEYYFLINQVKDLVEVNEALQKQTRELLERNEDLHKLLQNNDLGNDKSE